MHFQIQQSLTSKGTVASGCAGPGTTRRRDNEIQSDLFELLEARSEKRDVLNRTRDANGMASNGSSDVVKADREEKSGLRKCEPSDLNI